MRHLKIWYRGLKIEITDDPKRVAIVKQLNINRIGRIGRIGNLLKSHSL